MIVPSRSNQGMLGKWWWTIDRGSLVVLGFLLAFGIIMVMAASPAIAVKLEVAETYFVTKHLLYIGLAIPLFFLCSMLSPKGTINLSLSLLAVASLGVMATILLGQDVKGASRWINLGSFNLQPSEFVKPSIAIIGAWILVKEPGWGGILRYLALATVVTGLIVWQPDFGMAFLIAAIFAVQIFVAGINWVFVVGSAALLGAFSFGAYHQFPHVQSRIDQFLHQEELGYQIRRALEAITEGGFFGRGPGDGVVKFFLPEAHSDFVFATAAEEFGVLMCLVLLSAFMFVTFRALFRVMQEKDTFVQIAVTGLATQFGLQALINMAVNLNLMPTKGMTLPLISYGGSSMLAMAFGLGMMLALTRRGACLGNPHLYKKDALRIYSVRKDGAIV